jgi:hypothetical protein
MGTVRKIIVSHAVRVEVRECIHRRGQMRGHNWSKVPLMSTTRKGSMLSKPARDQRIPGAQLSLFSTRFTYATANR